MHIQSAHLYYCSRSLVSGVQCDVENCFMQLYVGPCHVVSAEIAVAKAMQIENPADCELRGLISFLQADEILGYLAEEASSRILPGRHKPCRVSYSIGTSSNIHRTVRNWHRRTLSCSKK